MDFKVSGTQPKRGDKNKKEQGKPNDKEKSKKQSWDNKGSFESSQNDKPQKGCWTCGGDHLQRNCPKNSKVTAMTGEKVETGVATLVHFSPLPLLIAMSELVSCVSNRGLMFLNIGVNGVHMMSMIDTGAIHNFVVEREVTKLKLKL